MARAVPASGTGSAKDARPGRNTSGAPHSRSSAKAPGPVTSANWAGPSVISGTGPAGAVAPMSVAPDSRRTRSTPVRNVSPRTLNAPRAVSPSTRTFNSAAPSTAASGGAGGCGAREERSISRLYSVSVNVTPRVSAGRGGCCALAGSASANTTRATNDADVDAVMSHHPVARVSRHLTRRNARSTVGAVPSAISSEATNSERPNSGNVTVTGSAPVTRRPPASF